MAILLRLVLLVQIIGILAGCYTAKIKGLSFIMITEDKEFDYDPYIQEVVDLGASHIALMVPYYQADVNASVVFASDKKTPSIGLIEKTIRQSRARGLDVMLFPIVLLENEGPGDWRGNIEPSSRDFWYDSYSSTLLNLARLAEANEVDLFCVGSELSSMQTDEDSWRSLCATVRSEFSGRLVYTSNWDRPETIRWWDAVDYMGISGYYELGELDTAISLEDMKAAWTGWKRWLLDIRNAHAPGMPILFTEIGYPSIEGGAAHPWDYTREAAADYQVQHDGLLSFFETWERERAYAGCFIYTWIDFGANPDIGYSPRGKPAEELIKRRFRGNR